MDEFERQLRSQPLRSPPPDWRTTILEAARQSRTGLQAVAKQTEKSTPIREHAAQLAPASNTLEPANSSPEEQPTFVQHTSPRGDRFKACPTLLTRVREWLWPHPAAWASLVAIWLVLLGVHHQTESAIHSELIASRADPRQVIEAFAQRHRATERLLAGRDFELPDIDRLKTVPRRSHTAPPLMLLAT